MAIKVGLIGAHYAASDHMRGYVLSSHVDSVMLVEADDAASEALFKRWGIIKGFYPDISTLLEDPEIGVVDICVPPEDRMNIAAQALNAGKEVICEQPPGQNAEELTQLLAIAERSVGRLFVCMPHLYIPANVKAGEILAAGTLGLVRIGTSMVIVDETQRGSKVGLVMLACQCIAVLQRWMGAVRSVVMQVAEDRGEAVSALISMEMACGGLGEVTVSYGATGGENVRERRLVGSNGVLLVRDDPEDEMPLVGFEDGMFFPIRMKHIPFIEQHGTVLALEDILNAIVRDGEPQVSGEEALATLKTSDAALKSWYTGVRVAVV